MMRILLAMDINVRLDQAALAPGAGQVAGLLYSRELRRTVTACLKQV